MMGMPYTEIQMRLFPTKAQSRTMNLIISVICAKSDLTHTMMSMMKIGILSTPSKSALLQAIKTILVRKMINSLSMSMPRASKKLS